MTTPTSKNMGMPTTKAMSAIAHGSICSGVFDMIVSTITSAPPEANSSVPTIEPSAMSRPTLDTVDPTPEVKLSHDSSNGTPAQTAMTNEPIIRERKGWILTTAISSTMAAMPMIAAMMRFMVFEIP